MTAPPDVPTPADVAEFRRQLRVHGIGNIWPVGNGSPMDAMAAALAVIAPRIREEAAAAERQRCIALAEQHKAHVWVLRQPVMPSGSRHMAAEPFADLLRAEHAGPDLIGGE